MANTSVVYARIDTDLKNDAEKVLHKLGITPTSAIQMLYSKIVMTQSYPIDLKVEPKKPLCVSDLTEEQLADMINKTLKSVENGNYHTEEDVNKMFKEKYGI